MQYQPLDIDFCAAHLADFVRDRQPAIRGPHETDYGYGWTPTISYWTGQRRVHLYEDGASSFSIEVAEISPSGNSAHRCHVTRVAEIKDIMQRFLGEECSVLDMVDYDWISDNLDHDKFIPNPPNRVSAANFASIVGGYVVDNDPP